MSEVLYVLKVTDVLHMNQRNNHALSLQNLFIKSLMVVSTNKVCFNSMWDAEMQFPLNAKTNWLLHFVLNVNILEMWFCSLKVSIFY